MVLLVKIYLCIKGTVRPKVQVQQHLFLFWFKTSMEQKKEYHNSGSYNWIHVMVSLCLLIDSELQRIFCFGWTILLTTTIMHNNHTF